MPATAIFGSTGAIGGQILATLLNDTTSDFQPITTISRRAPTSTSPNLTAIEEPDSSKWTSTLKTLSTPPTVVFNAVGTTRAAAGGIENQWAIDHDLCIAIAKAAKEAGVKTFVFISSSGTRGLLAKNVPYSKMKVGVEDAIKELGFEHAVIMRPGMILARETPKAAFFEALVGNLHRVSQGMQDMLGQDQKVIGRAAVAAVRLAEQGKAPSNFWSLEQADVVRLGRTEWKE